MLYLSDAIRGEYETDKFNVIEAPCGCGKSEYAVNKLPYELLSSKPKLNRILYLIDTCAGRHSIVAKYPDKTRYYDKIVDNGGWRFDGFEANRIVAMTYAKLGVEIKRDSDFLNRFELIIADEFHNIHWPIPYERGIIKATYPNLSSSEVDMLLQERCNNYHAMKGLSHAAVNPSNIVLGLSATPYDIETWAEWRDMPFAYMEIAPNIRHYTEKKRIPYSHVDGLIKTLPKGQKTLFYAAHIRDIKRYQKECETLGLRCAAVWSTNNTDNPMTEEQIKIRKDIIETNEFPENTDVLFINKSMETAINIYTPVPNVIVHSTNKSEQIQARGRIRHDIEKLYVLTPDTRYIDLTDRRINGYFNKPLDVEQKAELVQEVGLRDSQSHQTGWPTLKKALKENGCTVLRRRIGTKNYDVIVPPDSIKEE